MAFVRVEQRNAHLAGTVRLDWVNGRDGKVARASLSAISNTYRGSGEQREEEATAIQWTAWGRQAENAAAFLGKGSHVNIVGRVRNNNYDKGGESVYAMAFTAEEIDYLDSRADADARRALGDADGQGGEGRSEGKPPGNGSASRTRKARSAEPAHA